MARSSANRNTYMREDRFCENQNARQSPGAHWNRLFHRNLVMPLVMLLSGSNVRACARGP
jgi:hypothetical protein